MYFLEKSLTSPLWFSIVSCRGVLTREGSVISPHELFLFIGSFVMSVVNVFVDKSTIVKNTGHLVTIIL